MVEREVVLPVEVGELWEALTEPEVVAEWFGGEVEWDLTDGGRMHVREPDGGHRDGVVESVTAGEHLRFRWWPSDDVTSVSEVTYVVQPEGAGSSRLTVMERPLVPGAATAVRACAGDHRWSALDDVLFRAWARTYASRSVGFA